MNTAQLHKVLTTAGAVLTVDGDTLRVTTPHGTLTDELRHEIRQHKAELLALLTAAAVTGPANTSATPSTGEFCAVCGTPRSYVHGDGRSTCKPGYCQHCANFGNGVDVCSWVNDPSQSNRFRKQRS